ncbi:MAG: polyprenyl synthetase family protein [Candidatus Omnitrophica bacterium]|nr:polyprenyl synthetase family protein [Candidatus Omnitrophota bacterium]
MITELKKAIDRKIPSFIKSIDTTYSLSKISPLLYTCIKDFVTRDGKRVRPILFVVGYLGFAKKTAPRLYTSALAIELLHDFMLVHDDIIDKSDTRRGRPSMHALLNTHLKKLRGLKFDGQDLAIVVGDVMYAMAIDAFLAIKEEPYRKEKALKNFIRAAIFTGGGEFIELLNDAKKIEQVTKNDIYKIYDFKTAYYTFATPLSTGAILAGAPASAIRGLSSYGVALGRAFQIKDDILGIFGNEKQIGKSTLSDLQESKKTLLIWNTFLNSSAKDRLRIKKMLTKDKVTRGDLSLMQQLITRTGALDYAHSEIKRLIGQAQGIAEKIPMHQKYKKLLLTYPAQLLRV